MPCGEPPPWWESQAPLMGDPVPLLAAGNGNALGPVKQGSPLAIHHFEKAQIHRDGDGEGASAWWHYAVPGKQSRHTAGVFSIYSVAVEGVGGGGTVPRKGEARGAAERLGSGLRWGPFRGTRRCPSLSPVSLRGALPSECFQMLISELSPRKEARAVICIHK